MNYLLKEVSKNGSEKTRKYSDYATLNDVFNSYLWEDLKDIKNVSIIDSKRGDVLSVILRCNGENCIYSVGDTVGIRTADDVLFLLRTLDIEEECAYLEVLDEKLAGTGKIKCFGFESLVAEDKSKRRKK